MSAFLKGSGDEKAIAPSTISKLPDRWLLSTNFTQKQYLPMETPPI
ncbi:hypothetical protein [Pseudanabaena mucicola]|nr:hypothetical protein [Pseudanabaena mucicola]